MGDAASIPSAAAAALAADKELSPLLPLPPGPIPDALLDIGVFALDFVLCPTATASSSSAEVAGEPGESGEAPRSSVAVDDTDVRKVDADGVDESVLEVTEIIDEACERDRVLRAPPLLLMKSFGRESSDCERESAERDASPELLQEGGTLPAALPLSMSIK